MIRLWLVAQMIGAWLLACGGSQQQATVEEPIEESTQPPLQQIEAPEEPEAEPPPPEPEPVDNSIGGYLPIWKAQDPGRWNHAVAFGPSGDVVSLSSHDLTVFARHSGAQLDHARVCGDIALRGNSLFFHNGKAIVVCSDAIQEVVLPGFARTERLKLPWTEMSNEASACGAGPKRLAVGNRQGEVIEIDLQTFKTVAQHKVPGGSEVTGLAYDPSGTKLAVAIDEQPGKVVLLKGKAFFSVPNVARDGRALAFSPSGELFFARTRSFQAGIVNLSTGLLLREHRISSWLTTARFVEERLVAATGAHGTALFEPEAEKALSLSEQTGEGLGVSPDGKMLCSGDRGGEVSCWSKGPIEPSTYQAVTKITPGAGSEGTVATQKSSYVGKVIARKGKNVSLKLEGSNLPSVGSEGSLLKFFQKKLGPFSTRGWLNVAGVKVKSAKGSKVRVRILEERSKIVVNGKRVNHFKKGTAIKLVIP